MPASPLYDRLTDVAQLDYSDPDSGMITNIQTQITSLREACTTFSQNLGVQGATRAALEQRVSDLQTQLDVLETRLQTVNNAHTEARAAMTTAKTTHGTLSPVLLTARDRKMAEMAYSRESPTWAQDVEDHLRSLAVQRTTQREAAAQAALDTMNADVTTASSGFTKEAAEAKAVGAPSTDSSPEQSPSGRNYPSIPSGGRSGSTDGPIAGVTTLPSVVPSSSVLAGVDVTTMPIGGYMTADGPVGGYVPAPVTDANDPRWHSDDDITGVSSRSRNLAISGGALSTGGVLAGLGRMSTMTTSVGSSMGALASRAASSQFGTILNVEQVLLVELLRLETGVTLLVLSIQVLRRQLVLLGRVLVSRAESALPVRPVLLVQVLRLRAVLLQRTAQRPCPRVHALQRAFALPVVRRPAQRAQQQLRRRAEQLEQRARLRARPGLELPERRARLAPRRELRRQLVHGPQALVLAGQQPLRALHLRRHAVAHLLQREERLLLLRVPLPLRRREALRLQLV